MIEIVVQVVGELLFQSIGAGLQRRWGKFILGLVVGFAGGWLWSALIAHDKQPVIVTIAVAVELIAVPLLVGRTVRGRRLDLRLVLEMTAIGLAVVAGRWVGWALLHDASATHLPR